MTVSEAAFRFEDAAAYERFMGRWSRAAASVFLGWLAVRPGGQWLDAGCGTGILAEAVLQRCAPLSVDGVDSEQAQVAAAARGPAAAAHFQVADARRLPFHDGAFDVVASALLINFVPEPMLAAAEMRRVVRVGGLVAAYVWDFAQERSPSGPLRSAMKRLGIPVPAIPGTQGTSLDALQSLFHTVGLERVETRTITVCLAYRDFQDFWEAQTPGYAPTTKILAALKDGERSRLMRALESSLPSGPRGLIEYCATANAVKGCRAEDASSSLA